MEPRAGQVPDPTSAPELGREPGELAPALLLSLLDQAPRESPYQSHKWGRN